MRPAGTREPVIHGKAIQGIFSRNSSGAAVLYIVREKGSQGYNFIKGWEEDIGEGKGDLYAIYTSYTLI